MTSENHYNRRTLLKTAAGGVTGSLLVSNLSSAGALSSGRINGNLNQSVCKWCYKEMSVEQLAHEAAQIGLKSVELLTPEEWPALKKHGLTCAMGSGAGSIEVG